MRRIWRQALGLAAITLLVAAVAWARPSMAHHAVSHEILVIQAPWVHADPLVPDDARAFVSLRNRSRHDHALIGAESPAAARVELHVLPNTAPDPGDEGPVIPLPARAAVHLGPDTSHILLHGIQRELVTGTSIPLLLRFQDDSVLRLQAEVRMAHSRKKPYSRGRTRTARKMKGIQPLFRVFPCVPWHPFHRQGGSPAMTVSVKVTTTHAPWPTPAAGVPGTTLLCGHGWVRDPSG